MKITSLEELVKIAQTILQKAGGNPEGGNPGGATVYTLKGNLGSGKTTFTQAVARELGVTETVTSPTFVIQKVYEVKNPAYQSKWNHLIHIDAYRIDDPSELETLGFMKLLNDPKNLILIEWPERLGNLLDSATKAGQVHQISFTFIDETTREVVF